MNTKGNEQIKVLMYGWEYPPHISGGLGIACHAIVKTLTEHKVAINLVLPYELPSGIFKNNKINLIGWNYLISSLDKKWQDKYHGLASLHKIDSLLHPYLTTKDYQNLLTGTSINLTQNLLSLVSKVSNFKSSDFSLTMTGHYGSNLFSEVLRYANVTGKLAKKIPHNVIHAHDWMTILAGIKAKSISKKPLIFHVHALEIDRSGIDHVNRDIYNIEKYGMEKADKVIAVSNYTKNLIAKHYGIPRAKIVAVYNGIDSSYAKPDPKKFQKNHKKMVLFVGRITHQKGPHAFIEIAQKILKIRPEVQFVIAGTGDLLAETIEHVAASRIGKNVHFTGFLDPETVKKMYHLADVYVMPSISEPFGISCLEALAHDIPVVISKQSGAAEALGYTLNADFWDIDEMAEKILAALDHKALRDEMLSSVRQKMKYLTWDRAGQDIINIYNDLISNAEQK